MSESTEIRMVTGKNVSSSAPGATGATLTAPAAGAGTAVAPGSSDEPHSTLVLARELGRTYTKGNSAVVALATATCSVHPGDRIALVGQSGSGKSTLLHLMAGLDTPTSGTIEWPALGPRASLRPARVAFVSQMPSLLAPLTIAENVALPLLLGGSGETEAQAAALQALARIDLLEIAGKLPEEVSGGQAQRAAVARALAANPSLILADEPTGQLDNPTARHLLDVLLDALSGTEMALVIATHDPSVAERMGSIWHMQHGILEAKE